MKMPTKNPYDLPIEFWHGRGYLPHFDDGATAQFITFRLADSSPKDVIRDLRVDANNGLLPEREYHRIVDKYLDNGIGDCLLGRVEVAEIVEENTLKFADERYRLFSWVIMPNHVHLLLAPINEFSIAQIVQKMKSYTAHAVNELLGRSGHFWSKEYFDRYIRDAEHFAKTVRYIELNPVKAGLCSQPADWRFGSAWHRR